MECKSEIQVTSTLYEKLILNETSVFFAAEVNSDLRLIHVDDGDGEVDGEMP